MSSCASLTTIRLRSQPCRSVVHLYCRPQWVLHQPQPQLQLHYMPPLAPQARHSQGQHKQHLAERLTPAHLPHVPQLPAQVHFRVAMVLKVRQQQQQQQQQQADTLWHAGCTQTRYRA